MPIKIKKTEVGITEPGASVLTYVLVATGLSSRLDPVRAEHPTGEDDGRHPVERAFDEDQPKRSTGDELLVDVHLFWSTDGVDLEGAVPEGGDVTLHPAERLTRLTFASVSLTPVDSASIPPSWESAGFSLRARTGVGDQFITGLVCEPGAAYGDALMSTSTYLEGSEVSLSWWSALWEWIFG